MKTVTAVLRRPVLIFMLVCLLVLVAAQSVAQEVETEGSLDGAVYVMTNQASGNTIVVYHRSEDGMLTHRQEFPTGGLGSGPIPLPPPIGGPNPLDSQDSLLLAENGHLLLAVNAGSNEISVLAISDDGLRLIDKVPSGGDYPVSIAMYHRLVYVLNSHGTPNMTGFVLTSSGKLHAIPNSTRSAGAPGTAPAQVMFSPDGDALLVTERLANFISVFRVLEDGRTELRDHFASNNHTPFATSLGHHGLVALSESNESIPRVAVPNGGSVSTYRFTEEGSLVPISRAVPDHQGGTCWVRITPNGKFAYAANTGSGSLSSYLVSPHGELSLLASRATDTGGPFSVPIDMGITSDGKFLYVLSSLIGTVKGFRIETDGSLTPVVSVDGFPISMQGIVVR
ncbi:MAG TPA: beta-propeller fold lactonase family protein [Candidatus Angelobacter sp.]|nr:beta-propeller fold lactonase family protein [Candidatus Angelobacter sp.]